MFLIDDNAMEDFDGIFNQDRAIDAVVVGLASSKFNYECLNDAFR